MQGNFDRAYQLLSAAKSAVDALGGDVEDADEIRDAAEEAAIFIDLSSQTLEEMLEEAGRADPEAWASRFDNLYKKRSIIIDSWITSAPEPGKGQPMTSTTRSSHREEPAVSVIQKMRVPSGSA